MGSVTSCQVVTNMSYWPYKTYMSNSAGPGYEKLVVYWLATTIYDLTVVFCDRFIDKRSRTHDQMVQAARSGKQNIVEGNIGESLETNLKLTGVARNSFAELLEDYRDFLRQKDLNVWDKNDSRVLAIRQVRDLPNKSYRTYLTYTSNMNSAESYCNLMVTLCFKEGYLLDRLLVSTKERFIREGGFKENLFKKRMEYRAKNS